MFRRNEANKFSILIMLEQHVNCDAPMLPVVSNGTLSLPHFQIFNEQSYGVRLRATAVLLILVMVTWLFAALSLAAPSFQVNRLYFLNFIVGVVNRTPS